METGAKKIVKTQKTKFRKNRDVKENYHGKLKHHDKTFYRLAKEEKEYAV